MDMFASMHTPLVYHLKIAIRSSEGVESIAQPIHFRPFGPWRMRVLVSQNLAKGQEQIDQFLSQLLQFQKQSFPSFEREIAELRIYKCPNAGSAVSSGEDPASCKLVGTGR